MAHIVHLKSRNIVSALDDLRHHIALDSFLKKYPDARLEKDALMLKETKSNPSETLYTEVELNTFGGGAIYEDTLSYKPGDSWRGKSLYKFDYSSADSSYALKAFYFTDDFKSEPLKEKYAAMIRYADCLIDTTLKDFDGNIEHNDWIEMPENWQQYSVKKQEKLFRSLSTMQVFGMCSYDERPAKFDFYLAALAAGTGRWKIFLRKHLDLINEGRAGLYLDFYDWQEGDRPVYGKELEATVVDVPRLLTGTLLRMERPDKTHYFSRIVNVARVIPELADRAAFEQLLINMTKDRELDLYNRLIVFYLLQRYIDQLKDQTQKDRVEEQLKIAAQTLPACYRDNRSLAP